MSQDGPGDGSEIVLLGCLVKGHLRLWRSDGRAECVRVLHPSALRPLLARGGAPRMSIKPGRFREVGQLDPNGVLRIGKRLFTVEVCAEPAASEALWDATTDVLQDAAAAAIARGEYLVAEPGGWNARSEPYAIADARRTPGEWMLHVEAVPAPRAPSWPEPPEGQPGWGVAAPAEPDTLGSLGSLLRDAASMWAASPFDIILTFGKQADGPWPQDEIPPAIARFLDDVRTDIEELHASRQLSSARDLSAATNVHFNHNTYPVFFTGDVRSRLVLVHHNPQQPENHAAEYEGDFAYRDFDEYLEHHRRSGHYRWEAGDDHPSPIDYKEMRFLKHWGVIDFLDAETRDDERTNVARALDQRLQLELIPYGSPTFPTAHLPREQLEVYYARLLRVIGAYPRDYVIFCGAVFDRLLGSRILEREDHSFRLPTSTGVSRSEYRFSNLLLDFDGGKVPVGLAPHYARPAVPMDAYGQTCHELYRDIRQ